MSIQAGNTSAGSAQRGRKRPTPVRVCVAQRAGATPRELLEEVLEAAGLWYLLSRRRGSIVIKPDLDFYQAVPHGGTDPELVEHLIDLLHDRGHADVVVGEARNESDGWLHNRDPMMVPHLVCYRFVTPKGRPYDVIDLRPGAGINERWLKATFRIN